MIYLDIVDEIERQNVRNVISEFDDKKLLVEASDIDTEKDIENKIAKCKTIICDDVFEKIDKYLKMHKKVIVFIKKRKTSKLIDDLYLQNNVFTYTRKNELRELITYQLQVNQKLKLVRTTSSILIALLLFFSFSSVLTPKADEKTLGEKLVEKAPQVEIKPSKKELLKYENIVFFGDSITEFYDLQKFYEQMPVVNSGTSGFTTNDLLEIMEEDVYVFNPTKVVLLIGINDMNKTDDDVSIVENIKTITTSINEKRPKAKIYVESIYPVDRERYPILIDNNVDNNRIRKINGMIESLCNEKGYVFINMFDELNSPTEDKLIYEYSKDGLHLSDEGYKIVTKKLKSVLEAE